MPTTRISSPVLIGRDEELAFLASLLDAAMSGAGRAVLVSGEAGVGKSRLIAELGTAARERGAVVLAGSSVDFGEGALPFGAVTEALRPLRTLIGYERLDELAGAGRTDLARVLPEFAPATPTSPGRADPHAQARLFEVLLRLLDEAAREAGLVLVLDDLHWADPSTREFFAFLSRNVAASRILAVGTYRSDELHRTHPLRPYVSTLVSSRRVEQVELERLDPAHVAELVEAILGHAPGPGVAEQLYARSVGNPFFTEELLGGSETPGRISTSLRDTLLARVEGLGDDARQVLHALAVLARPADEPLLAAMTHLDAAALETRLREAAERHVLVRLGDDDPRWYFRHALVQEAVYEDLLGTERARIHRSVADALDAGAGGAPGAGRHTELARHYRRGHAPAQALVAAARAAREAAARYAYPEALQDWEQVLELWDQVPDAASLLGFDHAEVLAQAAQAAASPWSRSSVTREQSHRRSVALIRAALAEVDADREPVRAALGYAFLMGRLFSDGESVAAEAARRTALELLDRVPPTLDHVRVLNIAAYPPLFASRYADVAEAELRALSIATDLGAPAEAAVARIPLGIALSFLGRLEEGEAHIQAALETARELDQPEALADAYLALGIVREAAGRFEDAIAIMAEGVAVLADLRVERTHATTLRNNMAEALRRIGRWDEALEIIDRELAHEGTGWEIGQGNVLKAQLLAARGRHEESTVALELAWREFGPAGTGFIGHYRASHVENALWTGETTHALEIAEEAVAELAPSLDLRWIGELVVLGTRAAADLGAAPGGDRAAVRERADELLRAFEAATAQAERTGTIFGREVDGYRATAVAERDRLDGSHDPSAWRDAAAVWDRLGQPYPAAYARYRAGEAALVVGEGRGAATADLGTAAGVARRLGATPLLSAVEDLARRARLALPTEETGGPARSAAGTNDVGLTQRELEVAALLGLGRSDQEIADALFISAKTASVHVSNIKAKLGVERRLEAALLAARLAPASEAGSTEQ